MTKAFPTLYARGPGQKVLEWRIAVSLDSFSVTSGSVGFGHVTSKPTVCKPKNVGKKNATTGEEQALLEAQAKWDKQIKSKGYHESIDDIDKVSFIEPMLAKKYVDYADKLDISKGLICQLKLNGMRGVATQENGVVVIKTRTGEVYNSVPHINESLVPLFKKYPNAVLDGELFNMEHRQELNEIAKLIRRTKHFTPEHFERTKALVKHYVYDGWGIEGTTEQTGYEERHIALHSALEGFEYYVPVLSHLVYSNEELETFYAKCINDKQEGIMVRLPGSPYERKRSKNLLKLKPTDDGEFEITYIHEGKGNWSGKAKIIGLVTGNNRKLKEFEASFKGTMEDAAQCLQEKKKWIGKVVTIQYNGLTGLGSGCPQFAQFNYKNCLKGDR